MAQINADPEVLELVAKELEKIASDMDTQSRDLKTAGDQTEMVWKSRYTNEFLNSVDTTRKKMQKTTDSISKAAKLLRSTVAELHQIEREVQSLIGG